MATTTTHYGFTKPGVNDYVDISVLNANFDNLDTVIYNNQLRAQAAIDDLAPEYDATATYSVGDYVTYNKTLYRCTTAIATAEVFDDTKWTAVKVGGELKSHDTRISTLEAGVDLEKSATNSFDDGIDSYFKKVESTVVAVQAGTGTPSWTNVRLITGFTECTVTDADDETSPTQTTTATIQFGAAGTVYGAKVDLISGKMTVDRVSVDLGIYTYSKGSDTTRFFTRIGSEFMPAVSSNIKADIICSHYPTESQYTLFNVTTSNAISLDASSNPYINIRDIDEATTSVSDFKTKMNGVQLIAKLVTPIEYQLTPAQLRSLVGANRLTSSTGEVTEVEYIKNKTIAWLLDLIRA